MGQAAAILLAGGESRRMGRPKPLLDWGGETLIEYQVRQLREAGCRPVIVVLGHEADAVRPAVKRAGGLAVINELYREGRASSVRVGAAALPEDATAAVVVNVDQPRPAHVTAGLLAALSSSGALIAVAAHHGRRGHPVAFKDALFAELRAVSESTEGLREVLRRHERDVLEVEFDDDVVLLDLNTPADYEKAAAGRKSAAQPPQRLD